jgi:Fic family protein
MRPKPAIPNLLPNETVYWEHLIADMGRANRALAEYSGSLRRLPNPDLLLSPLTVQEAVLSSRIEGTFATMREVLQFEAGDEPQLESRRHDIEEILNYRHALDVAVTELNHRPFNLPLLLRLHKVLLTSVRGHNKAPGMFRREQNYIGSRAGGVETIHFTPPEWSTLPKHLDNWEKYYHLDRPDPLVQLAVLHAQFEFLHPFLDGNGRLGRILIPIYLYDKKLLASPTFYLSEYIEANKDVYIQQLHQLGRNKDSWTNWCRFFLKAIESQAGQNIKKADAILGLYEELKHRIISLTHSQFAVPLLDAIFKQPIFQASQIQNSPGMPGKVMLMKMLRQLREGRVLTSVREGSGSRAQILALHQLIELTESQPNHLP